MQSRDRSLARLAWLLGVTISSVVAAGTSRSLLQVQGVRNRNIVQAVKLVADVK